MRRQRLVLIGALLLVAQPALCRVWIRWTEPQIPSARSLGVSELVIPWSADGASLIRAARRQGYRVFVETDAAHAAEAAAANRQDSLAGIILDAPENALLPTAQNAAAARAAFDRLLSQLRARFPAGSVRVVWPGGKQPQLRGTMVVARNGVLQVSSPTRQPWIDSNVALSRFERAYDPDETPLVEFQWEPVDSLEKQYGIPPEDYELAVAEAGAFRTDLILPLAKPLQEGLAKSAPEAWKTWREIQRYLRFYEAPSELAPAALLSDVAVIANDFNDSYEAVNLLARHNISFRVAKPGELQARRLDSAAMWVIFGPLDPAATSAVERYVDGGRTAVWVGQQGSLPSARLLSKTADAAVYALGKGKVVEIAPPIIDPEPFARDVWRLLPAPERELTLWNSLTVLAAAHQSSRGSSEQLDLVNYAREDLRAQVRIKGIFSRIEYATPESGCCVSLSAAREQGFTEFIVPKLRIGGRVQLTAP